MMEPRSCVGPDGRFIVGVHTPSFDVKNLRQNEYISTLGKLDDGQNLSGLIIDNQANFPKTDLFEPCADTIYEIPNAFAFRGTSYINSAWADQKAALPDSIKIAPAPICSFIQSVDNGDKLIDQLPNPLLLALAQASTDPQELIILAKKACHIIFDDNQFPIGIRYKKNSSGKVSPEILNDELFEVLVNNPYLPDEYKNTLVLKPGIQGTNEITGEYLSEDGKTHVFEYLRRNSYIPWGHFASNMANDAIRYRAGDLSCQDMTGIRHLYYQRAFVRMASQLQIPLPEQRKTLNASVLESLRKDILKHLQQTKDAHPEFNNTLWGWNFGFGYAQSGHRLHASHQMIHQQNAMIPGQVKTQCGATIPSFACGDMVEDFITRYQKSTGKGFFDNYLEAIKNNTRTDADENRPASLIVHEDENAILFVPKAQVSEWELQLIPKTACGNIFEADTAMRDSLDQGILMAVKALESLGAKMVTGIEFSKPINSDGKDQHLLYSFIPRLPYAPGTFSEAQLRWISGCYPEDVAQACRTALQS